MPEVADGGSLPAESAPAPGELLALSVDGHDVVLANVDGELHALDGNCTHEVCPLSNGWIEDGCLVCECHGGTFDIRTGEPVDGPVHLPLRVHQVLVGTATITVRLSSR